MRKNLLIAALLFFSLGCRKEVDNIPLTKGTKTFPLNRIDNISFTKDKGLFISGSSGDKYTLIKTNVNLDIEWKMIGSLQFNFHTWTFCIFL